MNELAHYALIGTMVASVAGALIVCVLVSLFGFVTSAEGQPHSERRRRSLTKVGHTAAGISFGVAAVLAVMAMAASASSGGSFQQEFESLTGSLTGRVNTVVTVLHQIGSTADRLRVRLERFGDTEDAATDGAIRPAKERGRAARGLEPGASDRRAPTVARGSEPAASAPDDPLTLARFGRDAALARSPQAPPPTAEPGPSALSQRASTSAPTRSAPSTVAAGSSGGAAGAGVQRPAASLPERMSPLRVDAPGRVLPPPPRRPGRGADGSDASLVKTAPASVARSVAPQPPATASLEPATSSPKVASPPDQANVGEAVETPPPVTSPATAPMPAPAPTPPAVATPAPALTPSPVTPAPGTTPSPVVTVPPVANLPAEVSGSGPRGAGPAVAPSVSAPVPSETLMGGKVQPFEGSKSAVSPADRGPRLERLAPTNPGDKGDRPQGKKPFDNAIKRAPGPQRIDRLDAAIEKPNRLDKIDKPDRIDKIDRPDRIDKIDKPERVEKIERPERVEKIERPERIEKVERPERIEKPQKIEKIERPQRPERIEKPERRGRN